MDAAKALTGSRQPIPGADTTWLRSGGPGSARLRGVRRARHRAGAVRLRAGAAQRAPAARRHRIASTTLVERMFNGPAGARHGVPRARLAGAALDRELRAGHLADAAVRPLGRGDRDPGVVLRSRWSPAATSAGCSWPSACCWRCRTSSWTTRCPTSGAARHTGMPRRWGASPPRTASARRPWSRPSAATSVATRGRPGASSSRSRRFPDRARERLRARPPASSASCATWSATYPA